MPLLLFVFPSEPADHGADAEADLVGQFRADHGGNRRVEVNLVSALWRPAAFNEAGMFAQLLGGLEVGGERFKELVVGAGPADRGLRRFAHPPGFANEPPELREMLVARLLRGLVDGGDVVADHRSAGAGVIGEMHRVRALRDQLAQREVGAGRAVDQRQRGQRRGEDQHRRGDQQQPPAAPQLPQRREPDQSQHPPLSPAAREDRRPPIPLRGTSYARRRTTPARESSLRDDSN